MKLWSKEALLLGGVYGVLNTPLTYMGFEVVTDILFWGFIICAGMLCFNITPKFVSLLIKNYPQLTYYLQAIGWIPYFMIVGFIAFIFSGFILSYTDSFLQKSVEIMQLFVPVMMGVSIGIAFVRKKLSAF